MLRAGGSGVWSGSPESQPGGRRMKKVLVIIAILVAAAACGGAGNTASTSIPPQPQRGAAQPGGTASGQPTTINGQPGDTTNPTGAGTTVPVLQGPPVIRQAQLNISAVSYTHLRA